MMKSWIAILRFELKHNLSDIKAFSRINIFGVESATGKCVPIGVPLVTKERHIDTEMVRSSEPTNVPTQIVDGIVDSDSIIRINDTLPKKPESVGTASSGRKKKRLLEHK